MQLDQIGPTNAMRRAMELQNRPKAGLTPQQKAVVKAFDEAPASMPFQTRDFHYAYTDEGRIAFANLRDGECAPGGCIEFAYAWHHVPSDKRGVSRVAIDAHGPKDAGALLLRRWNTELWRYYPLNACTRAWLGMGRES